MHDDDDEVRESDATNDELNAFDASARDEEATDDKSVGRCEKA